MTAVLPLIPADYRPADDRERACILQGPHSTIQGPVKSRLPGNKVVIECNGQTHTGQDVRTMRRAEG